MGQDYWADADSDSFSAHRRAAAIQEKFWAMRDEVCAALASKEGQAAPQADDEVLIAIKRIEDYEDVHPVMLVEDFVECIARGGEWPWRVVEPSQAAPHRDDEALMRRAEDIIGQLCACHDEPDCPAVTLGRELQAELRIRLGIKE
jgi:hypothetical protein